MIKINRFSCWTAVCTGLLLFLAAGCGNPSSTRLRMKLKNDNPHWKGEVMTGNFTVRTPVFDFNERAKYNAVMINGPGLTDLSALYGLQLRIVSLKNPGIKNLDFLKKITMLPYGVLEINEGKTIENCSGMAAVNPESVSLKQVPAFSNTRHLGSQLKYLSLIDTSVSQIDLRCPGELLELQFESTVPQPDIAQIAKMKKLRYLSLKNVKNTGDLDLSALDYLEILVIENSDLKALPKLAPKIIRAIVLIDCPALQDLSELQNRLTDRLILVRSGDPGKLLGKLHDLKINVIAVEGVQVSNLHFYKRIKDLSYLQYTKCTGVPDAFSDPFVEIRVENPRPSKKH